MIRRSINRIKAGAALGYFYMSFLAGLPRSIGNIRGRLDKLEDIVVPRKESIERMPVDTKHSRQYYQEVNKGPSVKELPTVDRRKHRR